MRPNGHKEAKRRARWERKQEIGFRLKQKKVKTKPEYPFKVIVDESLAEGEWIMLPPKPDEKTITFKAQPITFTSVSFTIEEPESTEAEEPDFMENLAQI